MICDGYNEHAAVGDDMFVYRPFTRHDRKSIARQLMELPLRMAEKLEYQLVESRIVCAEWGCRLENMDYETYLTVAEYAFGVGRDQQEVEDEANLDAGVYLETRWPWLAKTSCKSCRTWWWNPLNGELAKQEGEALRRPEDQQLVCEVSRCPKGHHDDPIELSPKNRLAYEHFKACPTLPDDPIVNRNARIIQNAIERARADAAVPGGQRRGSAAAGQPRADGLGYGSARRRGSRGAFVTGLSVAGGF